MRRVDDFRIGELRIPAERSPLPERVEELLRVYAGTGQWEGAPYSPQSVAVFRAADVSPCGDRAGLRGRRRRGPLARAYRARATTVKLRRNHGDSREWRRR